MTPLIPLCCPNCRGPPVVVGEWDWIGYEVETQDSTAHHPQAVLSESQTTISNILEVNSEHYTIHEDSPGTPRGRDPPAMFAGQAVSGEYYHSQTRLPDGRPCLLIDPGSVGNLCGDKWAKNVAVTAHRNGHKPTYDLRNKPLRVSGVGEGAQSCDYDCKLPIALRQVHGQSAQVSIGHITTPTVPNSELPGLLGLVATEPF